MWMWLWMAAALAGAEPCYLDQELTMSWDGPRPTPGELAEMATIQLRKFDVEVVEVGTTKKTKDYKLKKKLSFKKFSPVQMTGMLFVELVPDGCEVDLLLGPLGSNKADTPVSLIRQGPRLILQSGKPANTSPPDGPSSDTMRERYGIGELTAEEGAWEAGARGLIDQALQQLTEEELKWIAALDFRRVSVASKELAEPLGIPRYQLGALYRREQTGAWFEFYDAGMSPRRLFVGNPDSPASAELATVLHEIGHALAHSHRRALIQRTQDRVDAYNAAVAAHQEAVDTYNSRLDVMTRAEADERGAALTASSASLDKEFAEIEQITATFPAFDVNQQPVIRAFLAATERTTPTDYAKTSADEAFAESFALFKLDPDALGRYNPELLAWFESGHYLRILEEQGAL